MAGFIVLLHLAALICFVLAGFSVPTRRAQCGWLGLALLTVAWSIVAAQAAGVRFG